MATTHREIAVDDLQTLLLDPQSEQHLDPDSTSGINSQQLQQDYEKGCWGSFTFGWVGQMMKIGNQRALQQEDLLGVPERIVPQNSQLQIGKGWDKEVRRCSKRRKAPSLLRMFIDQYGFRFACIGILKLFNDGLNFAAPLLLNALLGYLSNNPYYWDDRMHGSLWAVLLGISAILKAVLNTQYNYYVGLLQCEVRSGISCKIYEHSLHMRNVDMRGFTLGQIQTFMSVDADRLVNMFTNAHELWSLPLQIAVALFLLYTQVSYSFVGGVGVVIIVSIMTFIIAKYIAKASARLMRHKELRIGVLGDLLKGIRTVKMLGWQPYFMKRIGKHRSDELKALRTIKYLDALCVYFWVATQVLFAFFTFTIYVKIGYDMNIQQVFTSLALFNVLLGPLNSFPWVINGMVDSIISLQRLEAFLQMPERDPQDEFHDLDLSFQDGGKQVVIDLGGAIFTWSPREHVSRMLTRVLSRTTSEDSRSFGEGQCATLRLIIPKLQIMLGEKIAVVGKVGSGKSSLIAAILGEMNLLDGKRVLNGTVAYVGHNPWMMHGTVRENILLGAPFESQLYAKVILACALDLDIHEWPNKDLTNVGQGGSTLSGGQKVRIALARALYHKCTIYLLDDVLSSVDSNVSYWLVNQALGDTFMEDKTLVMVTKSRMFIGRCDRVVHVNDGAVDKIQHPTEYLDELDKVYASGDVSENELDPFMMETEDDILSDMAEGMFPQQPPTIEKLSLTDWLRSRSPSFEQQETPSAKEVSVRSRRTLGSEGSLPSFKNNLYTSDHSENESLESQGSFSMGGIKLEKPVFPEKEIPAKEEAVASQSKQQVKATNSIKAHSRNSVSSPRSQNSKGQHSRRSRDRRVKFVPIRSTPSTDLGGGQQRQPGQSEEREVGTVKFQVYLFYISSVGYGLAVFVVIFLILMQASRNGSDLWLTYWVTYPTYHTLSFYLKVFLCIAIANSVFTFVRAFTFAWGGIRSARVIHDSLLGSVVKASQYFFENTPSGRIINRFSSDSFTVDNDLPFQLNIFLARVVQITATIIILLLTQPLIVLGVIPLGIWYRSLQIYYRKSSRELRRLQSVARSPVYSGFTEMLSGLVTIRAFGLEDRFVSDNCHHVLNLQQATYTDLVASQWLGLRLQLIAAATMWILGFFAVVEKETDLLGIFERGKQGIGLVGLSITYVIPLVDQLNQLLSSSAQTEQEMVAVERIRQYSSLRPGYLRPPQWLQAQEVNWDSTQGNGYSKFGRLEFDSVWMKYAPNATFVLKDISIDIESGSHVLICGRTGAGKSSLLNALFRINPIQRGKIFLDGIDTSIIPLQQFRSMIGIVPQTPFVFHGSIQENIDPLRLHTPDKIMWALQTVGLWTYLKQLALYDKHSQRFSEDRGSQLMLGEGLDDEVVALSLGIGQQQLYEASQVEVVIGEGGIQEEAQEVLGYHIDEQSLSQGQQSLLALARVLLKRPRIVCLDEASASIDVQTAAQIQNIIQRVLKNATILQIAHDLENVENCDHVVVLKEGQVMEQGTSEELIAKQGLFYRLKNVEGASDEIM